MTGRDENFAGAFRDALIRSLALSELPEGADEKTLEAFLYRERIRDRIIAGLEEMHRAESSAWRPHLERSFHIYHSPEWWKFHQDLFDRLGNRQLIEHVVFMTPIGAPGLTQVVLGEDVDGNPTTTFTKQPDNDKS